MARRLSSFLLVLFLSVQTSFAIPGSGTCVITCSSGAESERNNDGCDDSSYCPMDFDCTSATDGPHYLTCEIDAPEETCTLKCTNGSGTNTESRCSYGLQCPDPDCSGSQHDGTFYPACVESSGTCQISCSNGQVINRDDGSCQMGNTCPDYTCPAGDSNTHYLSCEPEPEPPPDETCTLKCTNGSGTNTESRCSYGLQCPDPDCSGGQHNGTFYPACIESPGTCQITCSNGQVTNRDDGACQMGNTCPDYTCPAGDSNTHYLSCEPEPEPPPEETCTLKCTNGSGTNTESRCSYGLQCPDPDCSGGQHNGTFYPACIESSGTCQITCSNGQVTSQDDSACQMGNTCPSYQCPAGDSNTHYLSCEPEPEPPPDETCTLKCSNGSGTNTESRCSYGLQCPDADCSGDQHNGTFYPACIESPGTCQITCSNGQVTSQDDSACQMGNTCPSYQCPAGDSNTHYLSCEPEPEPPPDETCTLKCTNGSGTNTESRCSYGLQCPDADCSGDQHNGTFYPACIESSGTCQITCSNGQVTSQDDSACQMGNTCPSYQCPAGDSNTHYLSCEPEPEPPPEETCTLKCTNGSGINTDSRCSYGTQCPDPDCSVSQNGTFYPACVESPGTCVVHCFDGQETSTDNGSCASGLDCPAYDCSAATDGPHYLSCQ